jgi:anti-sigma factor (TIGR02949 family)
MSVQEDDMCTHVLAVVNRFLDDELDEEEAELVRRHLDACENCADEATVWVLIRRVLKRAYHPDPAPQRLLDRITAHIRAAGGEPVEGQPTETLVPSDH